MWLDSQSRTENITTGLRMIDNLDSEIRTTERDLRAVQRGASPTGWSSLRHRRRLADPSR